MKVFLVTTFYSGADKFFEPVTTIFLRRKKAEEEMKRIASMGDYKIPPKDNGTLKDDEFYVEIRESVLHF